MKGGLHFILSDNDNYHFDVKVRRCGFMGFVNDVIDYGYLGCVYCFRNKEKDQKKNLYKLLFYNIPPNFLFSFFFYFSSVQLNNYNRYVCTIYNCYFL